jgi:acetyl-CoA synthetase (ADP-forming)
MSTHKNWEYLFSPDSVAVIGASNTPGSWGFGIMRRLLAPAKRRVYPVNPTVSEVLGIAAYGSVIDIPDSVDLAVIAVAALRVSLALRECVQKGVRAAVIISGGFAETGEQGRILETELVKMARQGGIHFIGPNSMGHADTRSQLSTLAWTKKIAPGPVALLSQSGNMGHRIIHNGMSAGIGFSKFISTGNEAALRLEDYLEYLAQDNDTKIIAVYIEGLREGRRFFQLAKKTTVGKPVIVLKAGGTKGAAKAAMSHTGAIVGSEAVYAAAFRQSGVIRVDDDDELCDVVAALLYQPLPRNNRVGILTIGGGLGVVAAEACEKEGLEVAPLASSTLEKLDACLSSRWSHGNPVDTVGITISENPVILSSLRALMADKNIDAVLLQVPILGGTARLPSIVNAEEIGAANKATEEGDLSMSRQRASEYGKTVLVVSPSRELTADPSLLLRRDGIPVYPNPRRAARVLRHLVWYRQYLDAAVTL